MNPPPPRTKTPDIDFTKIIMGEQEVLRPIPPSASSVASRARHHIPFGRRSATPSNQREIEESDNLKQPMPTRSRANLLSRDYSTHDHVKVN